MLVPGLLYDSTHLTCFALTVVCANNSLTLWEGVTTSDHQVTLQLAVDSGEVKNPQQLHSHLYICWLCSQTLLSLCFHVCWKIYRYCLVGEFSIHGCGVWIWLLTINSSHTVVFYLNILLFSLLLYLIWSDTTTHLYQCCLQKNTQKTQISWGAL